MLDSVVKVGKESIKRKNKMFNYINNDLEILTQKDDDDDDDDDDNDDDDELYSESDSESDSDSNSDSNN